MNKKLSAYILSALVAVFLVTLAFHFFRSQKPNLSLRSTGTEDIVTDIKIEKSEIEQATENLTEILSQVRMIPLFSFDGQSVNGFQVESLARGSLFQKLGFLSGDKILGVNGKKVFSPQQAMELYNLLRGSEKIQINIERQGIPITLNYELTK